ncbi:MAG: hypothetical protein IJF78_10735 [Clostridia bacterium]|nr:hypothetical protein [Clostridia bacterium]
MTAFELLEAMGGIEETYLLENWEEKKSRRSKTLFLTRFSAAAASLLLVTGIGIGIHLSGHYTNDAAESAGEFEYFGMNETAAACDTAAPEVGGTTDTSAELPVLSFGGLIGSHGMEALMAYHVDEIIGSNPWTKDCTLTSLPVYRNLSFHGQSGIPEAGYNEEELLEIAGEIAAKMGTELLSHEFNRMTVGTKDGYSEYLTSVDAETEFCSVNVSVSGMASVRIDENSPGKPTDEASALAVYEVFADLLEFEEPTADVVMHYNIYAEPGYEVSVWDAAGDEREQILGYAFDTVMIFGTDSWYGINLGGMYGKKELIGEYPIITWKEAAEMLLEGRYISTVPDDTFGQPDSYEHVELVYRTSDETVMPYYKFRVHLEEWDNNHFEGEKSFGAYYVPAVSSDYLDESAFWDGSFN